MSLKEIKDSIWIYGFLLFLISCGEKSPDCFQAAGELVQQEWEVDEFDKITVFEHIRLVVRSGTEQKVEVQTGTNLLPEVSATVEAGTLILRNLNTCNLFRDYGTTVITVTSPDITQIRSSTGWPIRSDGVLDYPSLQLISESFNNPETETTDGSFELVVATQSLQIVANGIAYFNLRGSTDDFRATIAAGDSRIEARELMARNVEINHRGSNDMLIYPIERLQGSIRGTGDVLSYFRPAEVEVETPYKGRLIFVEE